ncbi:TPA: hypothetical protein K8N17_002041 [Clostridium perfringens]|uniref:hypothetical protein n=1 Tax=Clostridium perfringens TaxID=1502 RepID=UPI00016BD1A5|nr:hypothetical protein [Clostridium perfringens]EDT26968.1 hypothetical protein AC5_2619 [Clostridium perfringens CPE str. F4969]MDH5095261.1 hypothetical protein [Clostridium perfringens]UBK34864.1 hypothetical protein KLF25_00215 [Clostridium perfringens]HAT4080169.1 hypothetical protein [Clostridium perfringens]HAT4087934.1 hypothetical protein [Clostridium perfringens]
MNSTEREIYDKYAYKKTHIYLVYEEFERRVNSTDNEYEGLKKGECSFNYSAWEKRLGISKKLLQNSIKQLVDDNVIIQTFKGGKGRGSSKYFLIRFDIENMDNKKDNNLDNNSDNYKDSNYNGSNGALDNKMDNNLDNKMDNTSIYNNLNIKSNNIYSSKDVEEIFNYWNNKKIIKHKELKDDTKRAINKAIKNYSIDEIKQAIDIYSEILKSDYYFNYKWSLKDFLNRSNGISTFMEDGSNKANYEEWKNKDKQKEKIKGRGYANLDDL